MVEVEKNIQTNPIIQSLDPHRLMDPLQDGISELRLVQVMGSDLDVVNDARASFNRKRDVIDERDRQLIRFLIKERHTSPLRGIVFKFEMKMPLYIARQWYKHHVASSYKEEQDGWNEASYRYLDASGENADFYTPPVFHYQSESNRQASAGNLPSDEDKKAQEIYEQALAATNKAYEDLRKLGVCKQEARGILPACVYTRVRWTVSAHALLWFVQLRSAEGAQTEIQKYSNALRELVMPYIPETIAAFDEFGL